MGESKVIHRFWAGRDMPTKYAEFERQWRDLNPGWHVVTWNEEIVHNIVEPDLRRVIEHLYERDAGRRGIELYVQLADVIGYYLVSTLGGVYVNCDMQPVRPIGDRLPETPWASYENYEDFRIVNAAIGAPGLLDPFWCALLEGLPARYFSNPTAEMVETTGPAYLTDFVRDYDGEFHIFSKETFNPVHWKEIEPGGDASSRLDGLPEETIAVHHWGHKKDGRSNRIETATQ